MARIPKLLIVGMSHYSSRDNRVPDYFFTNAVINDRITGDATGRFFTNIIATCVYDLPTDEQRATFWHSVASRIGRIWRISAD
jgi:hypothetical protein